MTYYACNFRKINTPPSALASIFSIFYSLKKLLPEVYPHKIIHQEQYSIKNGPLPGLFVIQV